MKKATLLLTIITFTFFSCKKDAKELLPAQQEEFRSGIPAGYSACGTPTETPIFAGQTTEVGSVTVWNDAVNVYVSYQTLSGYAITQTHLYVGACELIPVNKAGNPRIGLYPYSNDHGNGVTIFTKTIPRSSLPAGCLCVSAHAEVGTLNGNGSVSSIQTGWAYGLQVNDGGSWAMKFTFCPSACDSDPDPGR